MFKFRNCVNLLNLEEVNYAEIKQFVVVTNDPEFCLGTTLLYIDTRNIGEFLEPLEKQISSTPFTPAKHVLLNWFSLNENYKQRTEKLNFP